MQQRIDAATDAVRVAVDPRYFRPTEVAFLMGNPAKARETLGWRHTIGFEQLVREMVEADCRRLGRRGGRGGATNTRTDSS